MIMRKVKYHIAIFVGVLAILTACTDTLLDNSSRKTSEREDGFYPISTQMAIPAYQEVKTRSQTYGNEGIESSADMHLFCFDKEGFFLGLAKDVNIEATPKADILEDGSSSLKGIKALVPNGTARIHFVANATNDFSQSATWMGLHENTLMTSFESSAGEDQSQKMVYWGYVKKNNPAEMKEFLKGGQIDNVVHLIRDRAKVKVELDGAAANDIQKVIVSIYDGQEHGTIALQQGLDVPYDQRHHCLDTRRHHPIRKTKHLQGFGRTDGERSIHLRESQRCRQTSQSYPLGDLQEWHRQAFSRLVAKPREQVVSHQA